MRRLELDAAKGRFLTSTVAIPRQSFDHRDHRCGEVRARSEDWREDREGEEGKRSCFFLHPYSG